MPNMFGQPQPFTYQGFGSQNQQNYSGQNYGQGYATPNYYNHSTSVVWVQGLAGAQAYPVPAGNTVMLMDSEDSVFYMKSTDTTGRPLPLRIFEFHEKTNEPQEQKPQVDLTNYVTWDAFEKRMDELEIVRKQNLKKDGGSNGKSNKRNDEDYDD